MHGSRRKGPPMKLTILMLLIESAAMQVDSTAMPTKLGDSSFRVRHAMARELERGWPYTEPILRRGIQSQDAEIRLACAKIREACFAKTLENPPWCDWPLWSVENGGWNHGAIPDYARIMNAELQKWESCSYPWENYRQVSLVWGIQALQCGIPPSVVKLWFAVGRRVDQEYERKRLQNAPIE